MDTRPSYRIGVEKKWGPGGSSTSWEDVSNLEELKQVLSKYGSQQFYLEAYSIYEESRSVVDGPKAAEEFTQKDFDWLIEEPPEGKLRLVDRYIAFKSY